MMDKVKQKKVIERFTTSLNNNIGYKNVAWTCWDVCPDYTGSARLCGTRVKSFRPLRPRKRTSRVQHILDTGIITYVGNSLLKGWNIQAALNSITSELCFLHFLKDLSSNLLITSRWQVTVSEKC
ncbi:hypothetical protein, partial [Klebsiella pneumoniae]|uniref:hypothetical protein n=1 Tax=Klebsiella pneumoniae TaxID=573 RepID=UPI0019D6E4AA